MDQLRRQSSRRSGSTIGSTLLRSCNVRRQLKEMDKFRVKTSGGNEVWMTKQGRIDDTPPKPEPPQNETVGGRTRPPPPPPPPRPNWETKLDAAMERLDERMKDMDGHFDKMSKTMDKEMKKMDKTMDEVFNRTTTRTGKR